MIYWALALLPAVLHPLIFMGYRRTLKSKRADVKRLMGDATTLYEDAFRRDPDDLFQQLYGIWLYVIPLAITCCLVVIAAVAVLARTGLVPAGIPGDLVQKVATIPAAAVAGIAGAFIWGLYDSVQRAQLASFTPAALHFVWLRLLLGASLAPLLVGALAAGLQTPVAFFVVAFPVSALRAFAKRFSTDRLGMQPATQSTEPPTLHHLQGLTANVIDGLAGAGVDSTEHLAHADPIDLLLRTNLTWKVIIDLIDQALLFNYVGDQIRVFRSAGIRGSVELAAVGESLKSPDVTMQQRANALIELLAGQTGTQRVSIENAIQTVADDLQVQLVAALWGTAFEGSRVEAVGYSR